MAANAYHKYERTLPNETLCIWFNLLWLLFIRWSVEVSSKHCVDERKRDRHTAEKYQIGAREKFFMDEKRN